MPAAAAIFGVFMALACIGFYPTARPFCTFSSAISPALRLWSRRQLCRRSITGHFR